MVILTTQHAEYTVKCLINSPGQANIFMAKNLEHLKDRKGIL